MRIALFLLLLPTGLYSEWYVEVRAAQSSEGPQVEVSLPQESGSVRFMVVGDTGTGGSAQNKLARTMLAAREKFPFEFVLMVGDNLYGSEKPSDYREKFEEPYKGLLDEGVKFYAALGNHDEPQQVRYEKFNMGGERYYTFKVKNARFFALDSTYMNPDQLKWLEKELKSSNEEWKICFFHHPLYSSGGRHGSDVELRKVLEPLFVEHGVDAVFAGHEHFYERIKPQKQIHYFTSGAGGKLRKGDVEKGSPLTAAAFDTGQSFMLVEIHENQMYFQTITTSGATVDEGMLASRETSDSPDEISATGQTGENGSKPGLSSTASEKPQAEERKKSKKSNGEGTISE